MKNFKGDPVECKKLIASPEIEEKVKSRFEEGKCLLNAYLAAGATNNLIVEGLLMTLNDGKVNSIVRHSWNKCGDNYYDVTKDYVWTTNEFQQKLRQTFPGNISYKYFSCYECVADEYICNGSIEFMYDYSALIKYISKKTTKKPTHD